MTQVTQFDDLQSQVFFMQKEQEEQVLEEKHLGPPPGCTLLKVCCDIKGFAIRLLFEPFCKPPK